jgi:hypothetical protein
MAIDVRTDDRDGVSRPSGRQLMNCPDATIKAV